MDNGLEGLLRTERAKLLNQVEQIDALLGETPVGAVGYAPVDGGNGAHANGNGVVVRASKRGRGVTEAIRHIIGNGHPVTVDEVAKKLRVQGYYPSVKKAKASAGAFLAQFRNKREAVQTATGAWTSR